MMFFSLAVCIHMQSLKWFCLLNSKIGLTLRLAAMLLASVGRHHYLICMSQKTNNSKVKIHLEKRFTFSIRRISANFTSFSRQYFNITYPLTIYNSDCKQSNLYYRHFLSNETMWCCMPCNCERRIGII